MKLSINKLNKRYSSSKLGLIDFSLEMQNGILGLLGPNGAGKSTLLKMIATVSKPSSGTILLDNQDIVSKPNIMRMQLGFLPQDFGLYPNLNAYEFLKYMAAMKGVGGPNLDKKIDFLLEGLNLIENAKRPIGDYSGGMKQRIGIAQALLNDPKVILFDEPTVGLDPEERVRFRDLISELANDAIVVLSSHIVSDIATIADKVAIMKNGRLLTFGNQEEIISTVKGSVYESIIENEQVAEFKTKNIIISTSRDNGNTKIRFISNEKLVNKLAPTLEDGYLFITKSAGNE
ncbi:MAG: ABC-2 type transport system ATP-binding protein [Cyclobacteriaceae bacterium]|jgi:ABC-2 type transport system ATP-binding protein